MPPKTHTEPGFARASGPSVEQVLRADAIPPPESLLSSGYKFLGDADIRAERYTDPAFFELEMRDMWPRAWQWACREEHIPEAGDHYIYDIGKYSVIVVRQDNGDIAAFHNACTHRGTRLFQCEGSGYAQGFACPFHGWSWSLDGNLETVPARWDFPHVSNTSHSLRPVRCECWGGFVFVNLDESAVPLRDVLEVLPQHFEHFPLERRTVAAHVQKVLPCNWKVAQEAFMEAYHNFATHDAPNGANTQYDVFGRFVSRFIHTIGTYSPESLDDYPGDKWRRPPLTEREQLELLSVFGLGTTQLKPGESARAVAAAELRQRMGELHGIDLSATSDSVMLDSIEYHLFPNMFFFAGLGVPMVYRFRPNGLKVDETLFDLLLMEPLAEGAEPAEPPEPVKLEIEDSYTEVEALRWLGCVYDEDTDNLALQQRGLAGGAKAGVTLGNYQEARIRRMHLTLDEYLADAQRAEKIHE